MSRPLILVDPHPRSLAHICDADTRRRLEQLGDLVIHEEGPMPDAMVEQHLPEVALIMGQTAMPAERLARAPKLRAIINVETNFLQNIDYGLCFDRGIHVITPGSAFALPVAETAVAMAIDLARGITAADRDFRAGTEGYGLAGNQGSFMFTGAPVGMIGYGDLARQVRAFLVPFRNPIRAFDPWLPTTICAARMSRPPRWTRCYPKAASSSSSPGSLPRTSASSAAPPSRR